MQLHSVQPIKNPIKIRDRLRNLPTTPTEAYRDLLDRLTPEDHEFARRILGWAFRARRILTIAELQEVLALDEDGPSLDVDDCIDGEQLESMCGGLIIHDRDRDLVTFRHETVRPFLKTQECLSLPSHSVISRTCLAYLRLPRFEKPRPPNEPRKGFKFGDYAAQFWATHALHALHEQRDVRLELAILETFRSDGRREAIMKEQLESARRYPSPEQLKIELRYSSGEQLIIPIRYYAKGKSLLHVLIENALSFIFTSPVEDEGFQTMYVLLSHFS